MLAGQSNLTSHEADGIRQKILSAKGLSGDIGDYRENRDVAEDIEEQVGKQLHSSKGQLLELMDPVMKDVLLPPKNLSVYSVVHSEIFDVSQKRKLGSASCGRNYWRRWDRRP